MSDHKWFTPAEGMTIPDPLTQRIVPAKGQWVMATDFYFLRRDLAGGGANTHPPPPGVAVY
jgi:hypothetical protein